MSAPGSERQAPADQQAADRFAESVRIMARLRGPGGCPWDREQTFDSIRKYTLEETYEVLDAIDRRDWPDLAEELGDLLLQVLFYAQMGDDEGYFSIEQVLETLNSKLIRRHPHVFGEEAAAGVGNKAPVEAGEGMSSAQVLRNWEAIKVMEKAGRVLPGIPSALDGVPSNFPALLEAAKLGGVASKVGFDWTDAVSLLDKVEEECRELRAELQAESGTGTRPHTGRVEEELGDLLFTAVNLARHLHADPELALKRANRKFRRRFRAMESASEVPLRELASAELEALWTAAKLAERSQSSLQAPSGGESRS